MVEASQDNLPRLPDGSLDFDSMTDDQFEAHCAKLPKMTAEEQEADMQEWINHPLNVKELTPEMLERPEF